MIIKTNKSLRWDDDDDRVKALYEQPEKPIPPALSPEDIATLESLKPKPADPPKE